MEFKDRLKQLRNEHSELSQEKLANIIGVQRSTIANYEQGRNYPNNDIQIKLADFFNVSLDYLLGKSDIRNSTTIDEDKILGGLSAKFDKLNDDQKDFIKKTIEMLLKEDK